MPRLLLATNNADKIAEFRALLDGCGWELVVPEDVGIDLEVEETGSTYKENARIKADAFMKAGGLPALADDSGLEVDLLNGAPGVQHHLKGWDGRSQAERITLLLKSLEGLPPELKTARFKAALVAVFPDGRVLEAEGSCEGRIAPVAAGDNGFGYDPVFYLLDKRKTMAELTAEEKNQISHRARAAHALRPQLEAAAKAING
jgi:XTP/dITP diphosphohydrolase